MLAMLPEEDDPDGIHLRVEGAACQPHLLNAPRRFGCNTGPGASVVVYRRPGSGVATVATGQLLVRRLYPFPGPVIARSVSNAGCRASGSGSGSGTLSTACASPISR
jgi:hypothetical protein